MLPITGNLQSQKLVTGSYGPNVSAIFLLKKQLPLTKANYNQLSKFGVLSSRLKNISGIFRFLSLSLSMDFYQFFVLFTAF